MTSLRCFWPPQRKKSAVDIDALRESVNTASTHTRRVFLTFLVFCAYYTITVLTTTHVQLLTEAPIKLPILQIPIPLFWFYSCGPFVIVGFFIYLVAQIFLLNEKANHWYNQLKKNSNITEHITQLYPFIVTHNIFIKFYTSPLKQIINTSYIISIYIFPIFALLITQIAFIPYHNENITWMNRIAIITQCYITYNFKKIDKRNSIKNKILQLSTLSIVLVYSFFVATIPTEYINNFSLYNSKIYPFYRNLYISNISLYSRYESPEIIAVKYYKTGNIVQSKMELNDPINLSERDLHGATFSNVTFPKIKISRSSNFNSSDFIDVNFYNCSISNDFKTTSFTRCNFNNCTIYETTIGDESLIYFCNFSQCKLEGIHIYSSDFESNLFSDSNFDTIHTSNSIIDENTYLDCKYIDTTSSKSEFSNNMLINSDAFNPQIYSSYLSSNTIFDSKIKNLFIHKITIESNTICNLEIINPVILASDTTNLSLINTQLIAPKVSLTKISNLTTFASDTLKNTITGRKKQ